MLRQVTGAGSDFNRVVITRRNEKNSKHISALIRVTVSQELFMSWVGLNCRTYVVHGECGEVMCGHAVIWVSNLLSI